nr:hypothetical protein [uncultured Tolumonas sp.]
MVSSVLMLAEDHITQLAELDLSLYSDLLVAVSAPKGVLSVLTTTQLLAMQRQHQRPIQLLVNTASTPQPLLFWAWVLGQLAGKEAATQCTILTASDELQPLLDLCADHPLLQLRLLNTQTDKNHSEQEARKQRNDKIIHALMKKVSQLPYDVIASKPVSSFMAEQVVAPEQQILVS